MSTTTLQFNRFDSYETEEYITSASLLLNRSGGIFQKYLAG